MKMHIGGGTPPANCVVAEMIGLTSIQTFAILGEEGDGHVPPSCIFGAWDTSEPGWVEGHAPENLGMPLMTSYPWDKLPKPEEDEATREVVLARPFAKDAPGRCRFPAPATCL